MIQLIVYKLASSSLLKPQFSESPVSIAPPTVYEFGSAVPTGFNVADISIMMSTGWTPTINILDTVEADD